ncbi:MAG: TonB-dependent receptor [Prevotella sp.]|nr:TonB-dependent receptor [Prevotella sp.]MBR1546838.1 TonB-dependent receptor [Prevotella sp.]
MYKPNFNQRKAIRFHHFTRKGYALFACLGRVVTIGVLSIATLTSASAAIDDKSTTETVTTNDDQTDKEATLDDVEVTGSRAPLALGQAARMVTVLSRDEIQAAPVQSINDLLKYAVGVDVRQRGPIGAQTDIGIRGGTSEQITILLNGINICDPQTGHNAFDFPCDIADIERIEVLEGPAGRVYGTSSLMGAINIVTRQADKSSADVHLEGGSFGYLSAGGRINAHSTAFANQFSASYTRSDGYSRSKTGSLNSDYDGGKVFYQGQYQQEGILLNWHAGLSTKGFGSNTFYSAKFDEQFEKTVKLYTALQGEVTTGKWHFRPAIYWNRSHDRFELIRGSEEKVPFNYHRTDVFGINLNSYFDWMAGRTALGAEFRNEDIVSTNLGEPLSDPFSHYKVGLNRSNLSFHLEHNILLKRFTLSAGFIAVKNTWNEMPFKIYPGIDASYRIGTNWKVYASYNSSLRMPSFTELYYSVGGHKADKYLKPEELRALEAGVKYQSHAFTASASVFHDHARNMIDWVMDTRETDAVWQSVNHTKVNTLGFETNATLTANRFTLDLAYCYLHQDKDVEDYLQSQYSLEYLRHKLSASLLLHLIKHLDLVVKYRYQDRMGSYTNIDGEVCDYHPYSVVDTRLSWNADTYSIYIEGNNLTSKRYVDYGNVPQPGCWFVVGTRFLFQ